MKLKRTVLIAACCLFVFLLCVFYCIFPNAVSEPARIPATQTTIAEFIVRVKEYSDDKNRWPVGKTNACMILDQEIIDAEFVPEFLEVLADDLLSADSWGTPFLVLVYDDSFIVISAGEDEVYHTSDDIVGRLCPMKTDDIVLYGPFGETSIVERTQQQKIKQIRRSPTGELIIDVPSAVGTPEKSGGV